LVKVAIDLVGQAFQVATEVILQYLTQTPQYCFQLGVARADQPQPEELLLQVLQQVEPVAQGIPVSPTVAATVALVEIIT
jgi:hypothetical protein